MAEILEAVALEPARAERQHRIESLVEKVLQITKLEAGKMKVRKEQHSLEDVVGGVLSRMNPVLRGRRVTTDIPEDLEAPLDELLIGQVLVNLLENALRHTPPGSPIAIRAYDDGEQAWVEVLDKGTGIPKKDQERIFEKFYRVGDKDTWGSGLGLAVCQAILNVHQGHIGVKDREGGGSVFYFSLPLKTS